MFLAQHGYDPFDGPKEHPEVELSLTTAEVAYSFWDLDEDHWFEGELTDGRGEQAPSAVIEVSEGDMVSIEPP